MIKATWSRKREEEKYWTEGWSHPLCIYKVFIPARVSKLVSILGEDWFKDKTILELACGIGLVGKEFQKLGAHVTFAEGRKDYLNTIIKNVNGADVYLLDQDEPGWNFNKKFDLVIHWGVLYHLKDWRGDLETALKHGRLLCLDTEVVDSLDPNVEIAVPEGGYDKAIHGIGVRPSQGAIEELLSRKAKSFKRYDDPEMDVFSGVPTIKYSWKNGEIEGEWKEGYRRFWMVECL